MTHVTSIVLRLAWRNLWRNHRRTLIMLTAVTIGVWAMIFMTALMRGMVNEMVRDAVKGLPGHVQVHHLKYRDDPSVVHAINQPTGDLADALDAPPVVGWSSRVRVPAVISSEYESRGVTLVGIEPERERAYSFAAEGLSEGRYLESSDDVGIVMGRKLADKLETRIGKRVVILSQDPDNEIADRGFRVVGLFDTSPTALEEGYVFTGKHAAQKLLKIDDRVHEIAVMGTEFRSADTLRDTLITAAGEDLQVLSWSEIDSYLGTMLGVMDGFVLVWVVVVFLTLSFGLVNTLLMAVFERVREIGLMLALGMKPGVILGQIMCESLMLLGLGLAAGNLLAWLSILPFRDGIDVSIVAEGMEWFGASAILYPELTAADVITANVVVVLLGAVAGLSPAWRASRYQPVEAITKV